MYVCVTKKKKNDMLTTGEQDSDPTTHTQDTKCHNLKQLIHYMDGCFGNNPFSQEVLPLFDFMETTRRREKYSEKTRLSAKTGSSLKVRHFYLNLKLVVSSLVHTHK